MLKRHYAQRRHIIHSLDVLCYQMLALSFFMSPSIWIILFRVFGQMQCSESSDVEAWRSFRPMLAFIFFLNGPALWKHATQGAAEGRAIILDFIGMSYVPSKTQLLGLDLVIIFLQVLLTIIAYETVLWQNTKDDDSEDILAPALPTPLPSALPSLIPCSEPSASTSSNNAKVSGGMQVPYIIDLRVGPLIARLRNPTPRPRTTATGTLLPLPNTISWLLSTGVGVLMRASARMRREVEGMGMGMGMGMATMDGRRSGQRTLPGSLETQDG